MSGKRKVGPKKASAAKTSRKRDDAGADADEKTGGAREGRDDRGKRLLDLVVMLLGARAPVPYREIRGQFRSYRTGNEEAGLRAFERDKADLLELGVPLRYITPDDDDSIEEAGYTVDLRRYRMPEVHLTPEEVAALVLAGAVARAAPGTTYAEVVDLALKKLAFDAPAAPDTPGAPVRRPSEPVLVHFPHPADAEALAERLAVIEQAIVNRKRLTIGYVNAAGEERRRDVDPYGLYYHRSVWYVVGYCHLKTSILSFRCDRMVSLAVGPKPKSADFERPEGFDVRAYAARSPWRFEIANETPVDVELDVHPPASAVLGEDLGEAAQSPQAGGVVRVRFRCGNPDYVVSRVLELKGALIVRSPAALRARVRDELAAVLGRYTT